MSTGHEKTPKLHIARESSNMVQSYTSHEPKVEKTSAESVSECSCVGQFGCLDAGCYCYFRCWMLYLQSTIVLVTLLEIDWGCLDDVRKTGSIYGSIQK